MEITATTEESIINGKAKKQLLYWSMASIIIFFGAFCSYYLVMHGNGNWLMFSLPSLFIISTALILASSGTMAWAQSSAKSGNYGAIKTALSVTFLLGISFCISQIQGWKALTAEGVVFSGRTSNVAGSILYVITFMHFLHIIAGLLAVFFTLIKSLKNKYSPANYLGLSLCAIFWHFLGFLWLILFLFLYFIR